MLHPPDDNSGSHPYLPRECRHTCGPMSQKRQCTGIIWTNEKIASEFVRFFFVLAIQPAGQLQKQHLPSVEQYVAGLVKESEPEMIVRSVAQTEHEKGLAVR